MVWNAFSPDSRPSLMKGSRTPYASSGLLKNAQMCARSLSVEPAKRMGAAVLFIGRSPHWIQTAARRVERMHQSVWIVQSNTLVLADTFVQWICKQHPAKLH